MSAASASDHTSGGSGPAPSRPASRSARACTRVIRSDPYPSHATSGAGNAVSRRSWVLALPTAGRDSRSSRPAIIARTLAVSAGASARMVSTTNSGLPSL
ncbi:hypothetical protein ACQEU6_30395 [Spirillospora sp. CA-108201]